MGEWTEMHLEQLEHRHHLEDLAVTNKDAIQRQIRALSLELARIENQPADDFDDGAVITFVKTFGAQPQQRGRSHGPFTYAAVKAGGKWYVTGGSGPQRATFDTLWDFIGRDELNAPLVWFASEWTELA